MTIESEIIKSSKKKDLKWLPFPVTVTSNLASGSISLPICYPPFNGHFDNNPILPGFVIIHWFTELANALVNREEGHWEFTTVKWLKPIRPNYHLVLEARLIGVVITASCMANNELSSRATLRPL